MWQKPNRAKTQRGKNPTRQNPNMAKTQRGKNPLVYKPISELGLQTYQ
jgi:hypothetical protein